jgi:hypothetical protein
VINGNSGLCMSVPGATLQPGVQVNQYTCGPGSGYTDQDWGFEDQDNGLYALVRYNTSPTHNLCLSVPSAGIQPGTIVNQWVRGPYSDQYWFLSTTST